MDMCSTPDADAGGLVFLFDGHPGRNDSALVPVTFEPIRDANQCVGGVEVLDLDAQRQIPVEAPGKSSRVKPCSR